MPAFTDTHCHLDQLEDPSAAVERARAAGVGRIVAVSEGVASIEAVLALAQAHPDRVLAAVGVHPVPFLDLDEDEAGAALAAVAAALPRAAVLGEVGLDHKHATTDEAKARQRTFLERQFELAAAAGRPANLHSRRALRETLEAAIAFSRRTGLAAQMHWFTQSKKLVRRAAEAGVYVSVGPSILGSSDAAAVAAEIPDSLLLLETDAPVPIGGPNEPARAAEVAAAIGTIKGWSIGEVSRRTEENFARFLGGR